MNDIFYIVKQLFILSIPILGYILAIFLLVKRSSIEKFSKLSKVATIAFLPIAIFSGFFKFILAISAGEGTADSLFGVLIVGAFALPPITSIFALLYSDKSNKIFYNTKIVILILGILISAIPDTYFFILSANYTVREIRSGAIKPISREVAIAAAEKELNSKVKHDKPNVEFIDNLTEDAAAYSISYGLYNKGGSEVVLSYHVDIHARTGKPIYWNDDKKVKIVNLRNGKPIANAEIYSFTNTFIYSNTGNEPTAEVTDYGITNDDGSAKLLIYYPKYKTKIFLYDEEEKKLKYFDLTENKNNYTFDWSKAKIAPYNNLWSVDYPGLLDEANAKSSNNPKTINGYISDLACYNPITPQTVTSKDNNFNQQWTYVLASERSDGYDPHDYLITKNTKLFLDSREVTCDSISKKDPDKEYPMYNGRKVIIEYYKLELQQGGFHNIANRITIQ